MKTIGERIQGLRELRFLKKRELAERLEQSTTPLMA